MARWKTARLRRLYGKPGDLLEGEGEDAGEQAAHDAPPPPPPVKRVKREKTRPESEYELACDFPVTAAEPDYALLAHPLSEAQSRMVGYAIHASRQHWLQSTVFETVWTRKQRGKKEGASTTAGVSLRDKMQKLHECTVTIGPHTFPVKLYTVKDDNSYIDDEQDKLVEQKLTSQRGSAVTGAGVQGAGTPTDSQPLAAPAAAPSSPGAPLPGSQPTSSSQATGTAAVPSNGAQKPEYVNSSPADSPGTLPSEGDTNSVVSPAPADSRKSEKRKKNSNAVGKIPKLENRPFASEREGLELEKKRNEELEKQLKKPSALDSATETMPGVPTSVPNDPYAALPTPAAPLATAPVTTAPATTAPAAIAPATTVPAAPTALAPAPAPTVAASAAPPQAIPAPPPPRTMPPELPKTSPNQLVVYKLQQMAARDPTLSELMKNVASGTASAESIASFQEIITRVKASIFQPQLTRPAKLDARAPAYTRPASRAIMLAFEFDESPAERYLVPKRSIIEHDAATDSVYLSFVYSHEESSQWSPVTMRFNGVPYRVFQTIERCVRRPEIVRYYMQDVMQRKTREEYMHVWLQIEKHDEVLLNLIKRQAPPMLAPPAAVKRAPKPRRTRGPYLYSPAEPATAPPRPRALASNERALLTGQPLRVRPMCKSDVAAPLVQAPLARPALRLPDPSSIRFGPNGLPPLPPSMQSANARVTPNT